MRIWHPTTVFRPASITNWTAADLLPIRSCSRHRPLILPPNPIPRSENSPSKKEVLNLFDVSFEKNSEINEDLRARDDYSPSPRGWRGMSWRLKLKSRWNQRGKKEKGTVSIEDENPNPNPRESSERKGEIEQMLRDFSCQIWWRDSKWSWLWDQGLERERILNWSCGMSPCRVTLLGRFDNFN